jgi:hypothetical protein
MIEKARTEQNRIGHIKIPPAVKSANIKTSLSDLTQLNKNIAWINKKQAVLGPIERTAIYYA